MTPEQQKQFNAACETFSETMAKIFATEAPTMERQPGKEPVRDWEILEFQRVSDQQSYFLKENGRYVDSVRSEKGVISLDDMLHDECCVDSGHYIIHSVRRLSDNTVWTVGDEVSHRALRELKGKINRFFIRDSGSITANAIEPDGRHFDVLLENLILPTQSLHTTADGIHVTKDQKLYSFLSSGEIQTHSTWEDASDKYTSEEAAKAAYISWLYSQPVLTIYDVINGYVHSPDLIQIVQQKLATK